MSAGLSESYTPRWLYISEFMEALPGSDIAEKEEAVLLLIRDRLIVGGAIDENQFRFLSGKPDIRDATWLANLSHADIAWGDSCIRADATESLVQSGWFLIEIAAAGLALFQSGKSQKPHKPRRTPPEQIRTRAALTALFGATVPSRDELTDSDLHKRVNDQICKASKGARPVSKDTVLRTVGRRK
jgi:hypothetical protein